MRTYRFIQADVFTDTVFKGNPLAIFPEASGLSAEEMQLIAAEMNLSETAFVLPPTDIKAAIRLRIFTPRAELPLAGHPVVGTVFILAERDTFDLQPGRNRIFQECKAGVLPVDIDAGEDGIHKVTMTQSPPRFFDELRSPQRLADSIGLAADELLPHDLPAQVVSTGVPQLMVPVKSRRGLEKIELDVSTMHAVLSETRSDCFMAFTEDCIYPDSTVHARMFAPALGVVEDPATGSAAGALGAYLVRHGRVKTDPTTEIVVEQGYEMGRASTIFVEVDVDDGPVAVRVGGKAVEVAEGTLRL